MWKSFKKSFESPDSYVSLALGMAVVLVAGMIAFNYFKVQKEQAKTTEQQKEQLENVALPTEYTAKKGDTLWKISESFYKSGYNWVDIQKANKLSDANQIVEGQKLSIPDVTPIVLQGQVSSAATEIKSETMKYTVVKGDSLWKIAVAKYGNGYKWVDIANANKMSNPNTIHAGNVLTLP